MREEWELLHYILDPAKFRKKEPVCGRTDCQCLVSFSSEAEKPGKKSLGV